MISTYQLNHYQERIQRKLDKQEEDRNSKNKEDIYVI